MALNLLEKKFEANSSLAPKTVAEAVEVGYPISVLAKVSGMDDIYAQVEYDLIKSLALLNLNLTIKDHQYPFIVRELVDMFSNESIQDFQLCFKNGVKGKYGKIYNVDLSVLSLWMAEYLDEKYQHIESKKVNDLGEKLPEVDYEAFKERMKKQEKKVVTDFKAERERQLSQLSYTPPDKDYVVEVELKREWGIRYHHPHTGEKLPNWITFEEFKKL